MAHGAARWVAALAAVVTTGCFNPGGTASGGSTDAAETTSGPTSEPPGPTATSSAGTTSGTSSTSEPQAPTSGETGAGPTTEPDPDTGPVVDTGTGTGETGVGPGTDADTGETTEEPPVAPPAVFKAGEAQMFSGAYAIAALNLDGDARADLVVSSSTTANLGVALGGGQIKEYPAVSARTLAVFDTVMFAGEELAVPFAASPAGVATLHFVMEPAFGPSAEIPMPCKQPITSALATLEGDEHPDLVFACLDAPGVYVAIGGGNGGFKSPVLEIPNGTVSDVALVSATGDSSIDLLVLQSDQLDIYPGQGNGTFTGPSNSVQVAMAADLAVGDVEQDGDIDLVVATAEACVTLRGDGENFTLSEKFGCGVLPQEVHLVDLNADDFLELVVVDVDGVKVLDSFGDGTFDAPVSLGVLTAGKRAAFGRINDDAKLDIAATSMGTVTIYVQQ